MIDYKKKYLKYKKKYYTLKKIIEGGAPWYDNSSCSFFISTGPSESPLYGASRFDDSPQLYNAVKTRRDKLGLDTSTNWTDFPGSVIPHFTLANIFIRQEFKERLQQIVSDQLFKILIKDFYNKNIKTINLTHIPRNYHVLAERYLAKEYTIDEAEVKDTKDKIESFKLSIIKTLSLFLFGLIKDSDIIIRDTDPDKDGAFVRIFSIKQDGDETEMFAIKEFQKLLFHLTIIRKTDLQYIKFKDEDVNRFIQSFNSGESSETIVNNFLEIGMMDGVIPFPDKVIFEDKLQVDIDFGAKREEMFE